MPRLWIGSGAGAFARPRSRPRVRGAICGLAFTLAVGCSGSPLSTQELGGDTTDSGPPPNDSPPPGPPPGEEPVAVEILAGQSIQAAVDAHPPGTTFRIRAGRHVAQTIVPKARSVFVGEPGAVLDGDGRVPFAFDGEGGGDHVVIRGLVIERYAPPLHQGVIRGAFQNAWSTVGWTIESCEIRDNTADLRHGSCAPAGCGGMGIRLGDRMTVRDSHIHHNDQYGIGGTGADVVVEGNEIAFNNHRRRVTISVGGGTKFVLTRNLVVRNNHVHDNWGNGIWTDIENRGALIEDNRVENNARQGIFHEIGYDIVIRGNVVRNNGHPLGGWGYGAGILIAHSEGAEVHDNIVENNFNGIVGIQQNRGSYRLDRLWVHDNSIVQRSGFAAGVMGSNQGGPLFLRDLRFENNRYDVQAGGRFFAWLGNLWTLSEWQSFGHDVWTPDDADLP